MALATLSIDLTAKIAQFEKDLGRAATVAEQNAERIRATFLKIGAVATGLLGGVTAGALVTMVRAQVDAIDGFNDLKDATGASIENISALDSLARRTGVTFDTVGTSLVKFNAALKEGDKAGVFKALGLDIERLKDLDPAEALRQTAVALNTFADDGAKARAVQELFGKSLREVAPLLKDLGEEGKLVAKVTTEQAAAAEKFNKELYQLKSNSTDVARALTSDLVEAMNKLIDRFHQGTKDGDSFYATLLKISAGAPLPQMALPGQLLNLYDRSQGGNSGKLSSLEQALQDPTLSPNERAAMERRRAELRSRVNEQYAEGVTSAESSDALSRRFTARSLTLPDAPEKTGRVTRDLSDDGAKLALSLTAQDSHLSGDFFEKWDKLNAAYKGNKISLTQLTEAQGILLKQQPFMKEAVYSGDVSDALSRRLEATERARKATEELNSELDKLSGRTGDDRKRQLTSALEERLNAGEVFSKEELDRIVNGIGGITKATDDAAKSTVNYADVFESSFERALVKGENLKDVLKGLAQDLATLYLRENVTKPLAANASQYLSGGLKAVGGAFAGAFGGGYGAVGSSTGADFDVAFAKGGVMTSRGSVPLRTYSNGGVANSPQLAMFGEGSSAEAYVPLPDGRRIPVAMKGGGGRPVTIVQNLTVGDVASMQQVQEQLRASERRIAIGFDRSQRYGRG